LRALALVLTGACLVTACAPKPPKGVDEAELTGAIGMAIGDPTTCVVLTEAPSGKVLWLYQSVAECYRALPACVAPGTRTPIEVAKAAARRGEALKTSCADVSWASGPTPRKGVYYTATMQGKLAMPGMEIARRMDGVFKDTGF